MNTNCPCGGTDHEASPWAVRMAAAAHENTAFRSAVWTGSFLQLTLMYIPPCGEIGLECHPETDQFVRVEEGCALVCMGQCREHLDFRCRLTAGDAVLIPKGYWHNICNASDRAPLKVSSLYGPPKHPKGTRHCTQEDAVHTEH